MSALSADTLLLLVCYCCCWVCLRFGWMRISSRPLRSVRLGAACLRTFSTLVCHR